MSRTTEHTCAKISALGLTGLCVVLSSSALAQLGQDAAAGPPETTGATESPEPTAEVDGGAATTINTTSHAHPVPDPYGDVDIHILTADQYTLDVGGMAQVTGLGQIVDDPYKDDARVYLFMPKARLRLDGSYDIFSFNFQLAMGGEDLVLAPNPGITIGLLDLAFNISLTRDGGTYLKIGQFLVPYGREELTDPGFMEFADYSMEYIGFVVGRDVGLALVSHPGPFTLIGGVFTGGGRDVPAYHYLPEKLGVPLLAARVGLGDLDSDPFYLRQLNLKPDRLRYAVSISGLYTHDSLIGHSTILNVKSVDKSILIDSNWNPFIAEAPLTQGTWYQFGGDAALRAPLGHGCAVAAEAQVDYAKYSNPYGELSIWGARAQIGLAAAPFAVAFRYDVLAPSSAFANGGVPITGNQPIQEIEPSASYYILGDNLKVVLDFPILVNAPVITEPKVGQYVATEMQDQTTVLATGGSVDRQLVLQARLMFQGQF